GFVLAQAGGYRVQDGEGGRRAGGEHMLEYLFGDHEQAALAQGAHRSRARRVVEQRHFADDLARPAHVNFDVVRGGPLRDFQLAVNEDVEGIAGRALFDEHVALGDGDLVRLLV